MQAMLLEDAGRLPPDARAAEALRLLETALASYAAAGAERDAARVLSLLRARGVRRLTGGPRSAPKWPELTAPKAVTGPVAGLVIHDVVREAGAVRRVIALAGQSATVDDDLIAVIDHGTVVAEGTPGELKAAADTGTLRIRLADPAHRPQAMKLLTLPLGPPAPAQTDPVILTTTIPAAAAAAQRPDRIRRLRVAG
jgi:hypothetical protein